MSTNIETLGDALPKQIARCQELLKEYAALGPVGAFGYAVIQQEINTAINATAQGDVVAMLRAYEALNGIMYFANADGGTI
jgi:hypothetical protein